MSEPPVPATELTPSPDGLNQEKGDAAWVTIETPFPADELRGFLDDVERRFRINSYLVFKEWKAIGENRYHFNLKNLSNDNTLETDITVTPDSGGVLVAYAGGLKTETSFRVEPGPENGPAKLIITDDYSGTAKEEREERIHEVDKSLVQWGRDIHQYLRLWKRWSWLPGWKWYRCRVWQSMQPMARRICFMLLVITALEFVAFLMVFTIFWLELDKYFG